VILGIFFIWLFEMNTKLPMEALTAIVFATGVAITFLFLPEEKTVPALIGDISQTHLYATLLSVGLSLLVLLLTKKIYFSMILAGISEDLARTQRINIKKYNFLYLLCIALTVSLGVRIVGGLMTAALVAIPACAARNVSTNLIQYSYSGFFFGSLSCILGMVVFQFTNLPIGPLIVITSTCFFLISLFFKK
jgi:ABC-type Mn2+/Zn2+ transport system permease subunit